MNPFENHLLIGGGGKQTPKNQEVALLQLKYYCTKKWHEPLDDLTPYHRGQVVFVLYHGLEMKLQQIAEIIHVGKATVSRDRQFAVFYWERFVNYRKQVRSIYKYIIYIA